MAGSKQQESMDIDDDINDSSKAEIVPTSRRGMRIGNIIGGFLRWLIILLWAFHILVLAMCCLATWKGLELSRYSDRAGPVAIIWLIIANTATPTAIVLLINNVTAYYEEIQSWQVAYITWGVGCSLAWCALAVLDCMKQKDAFHGLAKSLLRPFGVKVSESGSSPLWAIPLVAGAPALIAGFMANFMFEERYIIQCNADYEVVSDMCFDDGICCVSVRLQTEWTTFMTSLASTILASWGLVRAIGYFICLNADFVVLNTVNKRSTKKMFQEFVSSVSGRHLMRETIIMAEREETERSKHFATFSGSPKDTEGDKKTNV